MSCEERILSLFESDGVLAKKLPGFEARPGQLEMLLEVYQAYVQGHISLIEAGTGTGKSLAYLIPALLWALEKKEPTLIATHTIALQEQLIEKDIPFLLEALDLDIKVVLAKGMHNYVCLRKLYDNVHEVPEALLSWIPRAKEGSRTELPMFPPQELWEQINAEAESCTHMRCPHYKECFFYKARKEAADAQIIIANHHLLAADLSLRLQTENDSEACVLPPVRRIVIDEAHHLEDVATEYFADRVSRQGILHFLSRIASDRGGGKLYVLHKKILEAYPEGQGDKELSNLLYKIELDLASEKRHVGELVIQAFEAIGIFLQECRQEEKLRLREWHLKHILWTTGVQPKVEELVESGKSFTQSILLLELKIQQMGDPLLSTKCEGAIAELKGLSERFQKLLELFKECVFNPIEPTRVRWIEGEGLSLQLVAADLEVAPKLAKSLFQRLPTVILCSATLAANKSFSFMRKRLGIEEAQEHIYESPFDYPQQVVLSVPIDLPDPNSENFATVAAERIWETAEITKGGMFVLFTSYSMLQVCKALLVDRFSKNRYSFFCQGDEGRTILLQKFRSTKKAVLFGTDSFWEGVDVAGQALRYVIIVKLPFKVPSDPLFQARSEAIVAQGGSPFFEYSLPSAIVKFKQGFGRLIRNKEDRGWVICLDPRLVKKGYGKQFLKSLPTCPHLFDQAEMLNVKMKEFYRPRRL